MQTNIRINAGCGSSPTPGWVNFDNSFSVRATRWPLVVPALVRLRVLGGQSANLARVANTKNIHFANATARIPCASSSVSAVYSSHMIEHLDHGEARAFLAEVRRILRPGGVVRVAAPDIARLVQDYLTTKDADGFIAATYMGLNRPVGIMAWMKWVLVGPRHHLWMYDGDSLAKLLREAGFANVAVMPPGKTTIADPGDLDLEERASESVYVEAIQPLRIRAARQCGRSLDAPEIWRKAPRGGHFIDVGSQRAPLRPADRRVLRPHHHLVRRTCSGLTSVEYNEQ